jgi:hypothetical protein
MKTFQQVVELIIKSMPKDILAFIIDKDILTCTVCGFSIDHAIDVCNIDREYIINTNNRWFGFDGWKEDIGRIPWTWFKINAMCNSEFENHICSIYDSMLKKVEKYYERS